MRMLSRKRSARSRAGVSSARPGGHHGDARAGGVGDLGDGVARDSAARMPAQTSAAGTLASRRGVATTWSYMRRVSLRQVSERSKSNS